MNGLRSILCWDNHKCVRRDNISKIGSEITIGLFHRFLESQNEKSRNEPNKVRLDWFGSVLIRTKQNQIHFWFDWVWTSNFIGFIRTTYTLHINITWHLSQDSHIMPSTSHLIKTNKKITLVTIYQVTFVQHSTVDTHSPCTCSLYL